MKLEEKHQVRLTSNVWFVCVMGSKMAASLDRIRRNYNFSPPKLDSGTIDAQILISVIVVSDVWFRHKWDQKPRWCDATHFQHPGILIRRQPTSGAYWKVLILHLRRNSHLKMEKIVVSWSPNEISTSRHTVCFFACDFWCLICDASADFDDIAQKGPKWTISFCVAYKSRHYSFHRESMASKAS